MTVKNVTSPADGRTIGTATYADPADASAILKHGRAAQVQWGGLSVAERIGRLKRLRLLMVERLEDLRMRISESTGKVPVEALMSDLFPTLEAMRWIEKHGERILAPRKTGTPLALFGRSSAVRYEPRGVVLVISPWNYPFQLSLVPMVEALVAGNAVVLKPSEVTPLVGTLIRDLCIDAGLPEFLVQVALGDGEVGAALVDAVPDYIFFTGSVATGRKIGAIAGDRLIPCTLELGGKDPMIVFADADIDRAAAAAAWGAFSNAGQMCMAVERIYVEESIIERFTERFVDEVKKLSIGQREHDDIGSMIDPKQVDVVAKHYREAVESGGKEQVGSAPSSWETTWLAPMIVTNLPQHHGAVQEETFGPLVPVLPFSGEDEAIRLANDSVYALNSSVFTKDRKKADRVASKLVSGSVMINDVVVSVANHSLPFGGEKASGVGRYHGEWGLRAFSRTKSVMKAKAWFRREPNWFPYAGKYDPLKLLVRALFGPRSLLNPIRLAAAFARLLKPRSG